MQGKRIVKLIFIMIIIFNIIFLIFAYFAQPIMLFRPYHDEESYNKLKKMNNLAEEINIDSTGNKLNGWIIYNKPNTEKSPTIIYYLPNMGNSSNSAYSFIVTDKLKYFEGYNFIIVDYPGYGLSEGKLNEKGLLDMGIDVYDYAVTLDCVDKDNIEIMAYSIGTGIGNYVASQRNVKG